MSLCLSLLCVSPVVLFLFFRNRLRLVRRPECSCPEATPEPAVPAETDAIWLDLNAPVLTRPDVILSILLNLLNDRLDH